MEVGFWSEEAPWLLRRSEGDPSPAPWMDRSLSLNESLYILQENFFVTGDERKNLSENYLTDISFYGTINNVIWRNACDGKNMAGVVKWLTRRIVAPLRVGSSPTTRPIFFCLKSDIVGLHGGIAKR